jgi:hypothetical protein
MYLTCLGLILPTRTFEGTMSEIMYVKIKNSDGQLDPNKYQVVSITGQKVQIKNIKTGKTISVNQSRVVDFDDEPEPDEENLDVAKTPKKEVQAPKAVETPISSTVEEKPTATSGPASEFSPEEGEALPEPDEAVKPKKEKKAKVVVKKEKKLKVEKVVEPFDFQKYLDEGYEVLTRDCDFNHSGVKTQSHVLISKEKDFYHTFNTYNGSLGKTADYNLSKFDINGEEALDKKRKEWEKNEYLPVTEAATV